MPVGRYITGEPGFYGMIRDIGRELANEAMAAQEMARWGTDVGMRLAAGKPVTSREQELYGEQWEKLLGAIPTAGWIRYASPSAIPLMSQLKEARPGFHKLLAKWPGPIDITAGSRGLPKGTTAQLIMGGKTTPTQIDIGGYAKDPLKSLIHETAHFAGRTTKALKSTWKSMLEAERKAAQEFLKGRRYEEVFDPRVWPGRRVTGELLAHAAEGHPGMIRYFKKYPRMSDWIERAQALGK